MFSSRYVQESKRISPECTENKVHRGEERAEFSHSNWLFHFVPKRITSKQQRGQWKFSYTGSSGWEGGGRRSQGLFINKS